MINTLKLNNYKRKKRKEKANKENFYTLKKVVNEKNKYM